MKDLGSKHPKFFTQMADLGLSVSFGIPYSFMLFWKSGDKLKWVIHCAFIIAFFYYATSSPNSLQFVDWRLLLAAGLLAGFCGLTILVLAASAIGVVATKTAPASVALAIPGITLPLFQGILALIFVVIVHELSHGVLANLNKVKVNFSGTFLLGGFLPLGGLVEPDEKQFTKADIWAKRRILIAGTASNFTSFMVLLPLALLLSMLYPVLSGAVLAGAISPTGPGFGILNSSDQIISINGIAINTTNDALNILQKGGVDHVLTQYGLVTVNSSYLVVEKIQPGSPADGAFIDGDHLLAIGTTPISSVAELQNTLAKYPDGQNFTVATQRGLVQVSKGSNGLMGVSVLVIPAFTGQQEAKPGLQLVYDTLDFLVTTVFLSALLSLALAAINVVPFYIPPVIGTDGYQLAYNELLVVLGPERKKLAIYAVVSVSFLVICFILLNLARSLGVF
jgi:S1-C subfamily serine protease